MGVEAAILVPKPSVTPPDLLAMGSNISNHRLHYAFPSSEPLAQLPQQATEKWATAGHHHLSPFRYQHRDETVCCAEIPIPLRGPQSCGMTARYGGITRLVQTLEVSRHLSWGTAILQVGYRMQKQTKGFAKEHTARTDSVVIS